MSLRDDLPHGVRSSLWIMGSNRIRNVAMESNRLLSRLEGHEVSTSFQDGGDNIDVRGDERIVRSLK